MVTSPLGVPLCMAGRTAFFGGRWSRIPPCARQSEHRITAPPGDPTTYPPIELCEGHFRQVLAAGLITQPYAGVWVPQ